MDKPQTKKVTELPLYESCCNKTKVGPKEPQPNILEPYTKQARIEVQNVVKPILGDYPQKVMDIVKSSSQIVNETLATVKDENNQVARAVFITSSGFLGFLLGRRGILKRTTFGVVGALAAASYCNPTQAKDYAHVGLKLARTKLNELAAHYDVSQYTNMLSAVANPSKTDK